MPWMQDDNRAIFQCNLGQWYATMPDGWELGDVHPTCLAIAEWMLLHNVPGATGWPQPDEIEDMPARLHPGTNQPILCFSGGCDSTAALLLMPTAIPVYCERDYDAYRRADGVRIVLASTEPVRRFLDKVPGVIRVPNTLELVGIAGGTAHGFRDGYGYAVMALLLADFLQSDAVAFGSVMEQVFLGSGHRYTDIVDNKLSRWNFYSRLFACAGLDFLVPTGCCSEVVTAIIVDRSEWANDAVSCPLPHEDGTPCGTCFKCFRKLRILGHEAKEPAARVLAVLNKRPVKSATSTIYACQKANWWGAGLDEYRGIRLDFLERYYNSGLRSTISQPWAASIELQFSELGISAMSCNEEICLEHIADVFSPAPTPMLDSQSLE